MPQIGPKLQYNGGEWRQKAAISRGASCKFVSRRKCVIWRLLAILRFAHDRPMLRISPNLRSCGGKSLPRTHAAANREFDRRAALWLPYRGLEGGPFVPISADYDETAALWLHYGAGGRPFVPLCGHYDETAALWLPYRGLEGGLLSRYLRIMATMR